MGDVGLISSLRSLNFLKASKSPYTGMRRFKSVVQAQRFLSVHAVVYTLFNLQRYLVGAVHFRQLKDSAFVSRKSAVSD